MLTYSRTGSDAAHRPARTRVLLLYVLCSSLALYPLMEQFMAPIIGIAFLCVTTDVVFRWTLTGLRIPHTFVTLVWLVYGAVYVLWFLIGMIHDNNMTYIRGDSLGFLLYLGILPILYLYVVMHRLERAFVGYLIHLSTFIAVISFLAVAGYFVIFGPIEHDSLLLLNAFLSALGLTWQVDNNSGLLGVYTYTGHILLIGTALVLYRYSRTPNWKDLALAVLYFVGVVLDGHRALVVAILLQYLLLAPALLGRLNARVKLTLLAGVTLVCMVTAITAAGWIAERFDFSANDASSAERYAQIPALMDKIQENPVMGGGFGTVATHIRSEARPYYYEMDFLATAMKLGLIGSLLYFGTYILVLIHGLLSREAGLFLLSAGLPFLFYMGTNGGQAMSTDSAIFHIYLFILIAISAERVPRRKKRNPMAVAAP